MKVKDAKKSRRDICIIFKFYPLLFKTNNSSCCRRSTPEARSFAFDNENKLKTIFLAITQLLITGGAGFIGSNTCLVMLQAGLRLIVLGDFSNSSSIALKRVDELAGGESTAQLNLFKETSATEASSSEPWLKPRHLLMLSYILRG